MNEQQVDEIIEMMFFAYRDFTNDPDLLLQKLNFGRAHHRVLHFVSRTPGLTVAELLDVLRITKQSLARVLKQLVEEEFIEQVPGAHDRRQRHLHLTQKGHTLIEQLRQPQQMRIKKALQSTGMTTQEALGFLSQMCDQHQGKGQVS